MRPASNETSRGRRGLAATVLATVTTVAFIGLGGLPAVADPGDVAIDVYSMNDFHGRLETTDSTAGAAVVAGAFKGFKATNPNSTLVSAGDNVGASTFVSFIQDDEPTIEALNATGLSVTAVGNHELDHGYADLTERIEAHADYKHISANLFKKSDGSHAVAPYEIQDFEGVKVGFIGATTEDLPYLVSPDGIATINVASIVDSVNAVAADLKDGNDANGEADVLILLIHEGAATPTTDVTDTSTVFGKIVMGTGPNLDAIASGHTHQAYNHPAVDVGGGHTLPVIQTGSYGTFLGKISLEVNPTTKQLSSITSSLIPLMTGTQPAFPADPTVKAIVDQAVADADVKGSVKAGTITASLKRAVQSTGAENRGGESSLSNLVADAQLWATSQQGSQIAFMNPGGLRQNIDYLKSGTETEDGFVSFKEAAVVQPFANTLVTQTLTGAQVKTVLEQQWQPGKSRPMLKLGTNKELTYTYDPSAAVGSKISEIFYNGVAISPEQTFVVVANSFLAAGGDNFTELANGLNSADTGQNDLQAFVNYMAAMSPLSPDYGTRSIGIVNTTPVADDAVTSRSAGTVSAAVLGTAKPGAEFSFDLSSLSLSSADVKDPEVVVLFDGVELSRSAIDHTIVDTFDEQGQASVAFTIPLVTNGAHTVTFSLPLTNVSLDFPVTIVEGIEPTTPPTTVPTDPTTPAGSTPAGAGTLAATGSEAGQLALFAGLVLLAGLSGVLLRRRTAVKR